MQKRFIGYIEDLTQENMLFSVKSNSTPGVKSGMAVYLDPDTLVLSIQPGSMIMPDGMVVGETETVSIQLVEPGTGDYWVTLIASRLVEAGMVNDEVRYEIISNRLASDALTNVTNMVRMPIAWIQKVGSAYYVTNLGKRTTNPTEIYSTPFPQIYTPNVDVVYSDGVFYRNFKSTDDYFYLRLPKDPDNFISSIRVTARSADTSYLQMTALKTTVLGSTSPITTQVGFTSEGYTMQSLVYPARTYSFEDLIQFKVTSVATLSISEISVVRTRVF